MKKLIATLLAVGLVATLGACGAKKDDATLKVAATAVPHAEILNACKDMMKEKGYTLEVTEYSDYIIPNTAVEEGEEDANFFQHTP